VLDSIGCGGIISIIILTTVAVTNISFCMYDPEIVVYIMVGEKKIMARRFEIMDANTRE